VGGIPSFPISGWFLPAASGIPVKLFLEDALLGVRLSDASVPPAQNAAVLLGTIMGVAATQFGR
jgi:transaldolase/glucose-6-phosphate isomerase